MKKFFSCTILFLSALVLTNASSNPQGSVEKGKVHSVSAPADNQAEIKFEYETHNFGTIVQGTKATYIFKCRNTGSGPLVISYIDTPCGCTSREWTKTPIFPGAMGEVIVTFNSAGKLGAFHKTITVSSNAKTNPTKLTLRATVIKGEAVKE
jgi:hypothetical protein